MNKVAHIALDPECLDRAWILRLRQRAKFRPGQHASAALLVYAFSTWLPGRSFIETRISGEF